MGFLKKSIRNLISRTAPVEAAAAPAGPVARVLTTDPVKAAAPAGPVARVLRTDPVEAAAAPAGRGIFGKLQQAGGAKRLAKGIGKGLKRMGFKDGGSVKASRSVVSSGRGDGAAIRGKTKCKMY